MKKPGTIQSLMIPVFILFLLTLWKVPVVPQESKEQLQKNKKQLEDEIRLTSSLLDATRQNRQTSLNHLVLLKKQVSQRQALIGAITKEIDDIQGRIDQQNQQISKLNGELKKMKDEYAKMIYYAYKNLNSYNRLLFIFSARDFNQAFDRLKYYQQYSAYRRTQAELIRNKQIEITQSKRQLEESRAQKMALIKTKESEILAISSEKDEEDQTVAALSQKEKQLKATLKEKQQAADRLQKEIEKIIAEEIRASASKTKTPAGSEMKKGTAETGMMLTPVEMELSSSFAANKGKLPWPAERGIITETFGEHPHPVLKYVKTKNNGVDIAMEKGAGVRSVFNGRVSRVMSFPNFNKVVIIRHGEYLTVYSNLDEVFVKDSENVTTKEVIGKVHTDPDDSKTELHFEIWLGKTLQDPQQWLAGANP
jgi:septal ring factor EnvC (AmiA/AmiB activator)